MGYLIFARREYQHPLEWIGRLRRDDASDTETETIKRQALERFGDEEWIEMVAVPEHAAVRVIPLEQPS